MGSFPQRSPGVLLSSLGDQAVAYDLVSETAHHLNGTAGAILAACDGSTDQEAAVAEWAEATGTDATIVATDVAAGLGALANLGLVGRRKAFEPTPPPVGSTAGGADGSVTGAVHLVLDWAISFRSAQPELLAVVDDFLDSGHTAPGTPLVFDIEERDDGQVRLVTDYEWLFPTRKACLDQLTTVMNEYAVWTHTCASLHAGAVRSAAGELVVLPAVSGGGKSTLTGAFVTAGWDYLGDEAIGIRAATNIAVGYPKRLAIDATSRAVLGLPASDAWDVDPRDLRSDAVRLGGDVGPISRVVLPTYVEGTGTTLEDLDPPAALDALLANTLNLGRAGQPGLDALCDLAASVPVQRLTHDDAHRAVQHIEMLPSRASESG